MAASSALRVRARARMFIKISPFCYVVSISSLTCAYTGAGMTQLILGSSSVSRRQILSEMGYKFTLLLGFLCSIVCVVCFSNFFSRTFQFIHFNFFPGALECGYR